MFEHTHGGKKQEKRGAVPAMAVAVVAHAVVLTLLAVGMRRDVLLAIESAGDGPSVDFPEGGGGDGGGSGGELVSYVDIPPPPPVEEETVEVVEEEEDVLVPPEEEVVPPPPPPPPVQQPAQPRPAPVLPAPPTGGTGGGTGGGEGAGEGPGTGPGTGPGSGGGSGGGTGGGIGSGTGPGTGGGESRIRPPTTDLLLIPPERPGGVARQDVTIRLRIDARGRVRDARLVSSTGNRGYDSRIVRWARDLLFRPAVNIDTNRPVEAEYELEISV